jgi:hypothetical protein
MRYAYDHRLRDQVVRSGTRCLPKHVAIPRSTVSTWRRRGARPVVTIEPIEQDRQQLLDTIAKLEQQKCILAAVVRVLLALLRASGFTLAGEWLPEGSAKAGLLRAITSAIPFLPLAVILRIVHLEPGRYHQWNRASTAICGLDDRSSCPRTSPKLLDGTKVYLHAVLDNYSRKILAWTVADRFDPSSTCQVLLAAGKHLVIAGRPLLYADSGIENVNGAVDATLFSACLERILAQVEVIRSSRPIGVH